MRKSVLVIDSPENCCSVQCSTVQTSAYYRMTTQISMADTLDELRKGCLLRVLPEKMKLTGKYNQEYFEKGGKAPSYKVGWNDCIDEITGGMD